ncbi:hypothetical protein FHW83_003292 [Duganella sp. SG902]|uniref:hypothetical protein n=1 Tax=Duganella sp. SG902 TaxID=2587016 RepID=UPI00159E7C5E|nr:hypothetical protein [Duganella sp. SG902]NVM77474.1 hypothetical protein [Duganella sp. SG902]
MAIRPNRINVNLGPYKAPWLAYCRATGENPSSLFRQLVAQLLADAIDVTTPEPVAAGKTRKEVRLTPDEQQHVAAAALHAGVSEVRWISALIRAHMSAQVQLGPLETEALGRSNLALLAIGRNLNQLVRAVHMGEVMLPTELTAVLAALRVQLSSHVEEVAAILSANLNRWRTS